MTLPLMSEAESEELMDKRAATYQAKLVPATKQYLFALTKGNPCYITQTGQAGAKQEKAFLHPDFTNRPDQNLMT